MAPRPTHGAVSQRPATRSRSTIDTNGETKNTTNGIAHNHDMEQEYHTEESEVSDAEGTNHEEAEDLNNESNNDSISETALSEPPLLPLDLLQPLPSPANSPRIPYSQMRRKDKRAERHRSRKAKKREWDRLREEVGSNGLVLAAGRAAQRKRGIVGGRRVKSGRVEKKTSVPASGRQLLLEQRKRAVEKSLAESTGSPKKAKTKPRR